MEMNDMEGATMQVASLETDRDIRLSLLSPSLVDPFERDCDERTAFI